MPGRDLRWYLRRLRAMSPSEVVHQMAVRGRLEAWVHFPPITSSPVIPSEPSRSSRIHTSLKGDEVDRLVDSAERMLLGEYVFLGVEDPDGPEHWHRDPESGVTCPLSPSPRIDFSNARLVGNVKNVWEKSRHQHLTLLASAYAFSGDERFADEVASQLRSWCDANPFLRGVNWASGIEVALRLVSWVWTERLLRGSNAHDALFGPEGSMWVAVQRSVALLEAIPSLGSSANNHAIAEMLGLVVAYDSWPYWDGWGEKAVRAARDLERHSEVYLAPSGFSREMAFGYHVFATEMYLVALAEHALGEPLFTDSFVERVLSAVAAAGELEAAGGGQMGDSDDSCVLVVEDARVSRAEYLSAFARVLAARGAEAGAAPVLSSLLDGSGGRPISRTTCDHARPALTDVGLHVLASHGEVPAVCLFDAGPLGYLGLAAHGHADALSFTLSLDGRPFIVDPGTYKFGDAPEWRRYFRGTAAHNTIRIDGQDQSVQAGPFLWADHAAAETLETSASEDVSSVRARHNGYARLASPVNHTRTLDLSLDSLSVRDRLLTAGGHVVEWRLHLHPDVSASVEGGRLIVRGECVLLEVDLDPSFEWSLREAADDAGWYSDAFNCRRHCSTLVGTATTAGPVEVWTSMRWRRAV